MIDEDDLRRRTAGLREATAARSLREVHERARAIRRTRRTARAGAGVAAAVAAVALAQPAQSLLPAPAIRADGPVTAPAPRTAPATATPGPTALPSAVSSPTPGSTASPGPAPTPGGGGGCGAGISGAVALRSVADLLYLPRAGAVRDRLAAAVSAHEEQAACPPVPVAGLWYALSGDRAVRRAELYGAGAADAGSGLAGTNRSATVRGLVVHLQSGRNAGGVFADAYWHEADGSSWSLVTAGVSPDDVVRLVGSGTAPGLHPTGLDVTVPVTAGRQLGQVKRTVSASFGSVDEDGGGWSLRVSTAGGTFEGRGRRVSVGGREGWWITGGGGGLYWRGSRGEQFSLTGSITLTKALPVAGSLEQVRPEDPRLSGRAAH